MSASAHQFAVRLFEVDPELLHPLPEADRQRIAHAALVEARRISVGAWAPQELGAPRWGALVLEGLVAREVVVAGTASAELLGAGDLLFSVTATGDEMFASESRWTVLEPLHVALLDDRFERILRQWPGLAGCLLERAERRAGRLAVAQAISHLTRVDTRVLVMLWVLAGRWGRVGPDGIVLPLRLTHRTIARLVGARRPSVTTAITELCRRELVARRDDGSWLLHGPPPEELDRVGIDRILPVPAPPRRASDAAPAAAAPPAAAPPARRSESPVSQRIDTLAAQITALAAAYETHAEMSRTLSTHSSAVRDRSRALRAEIAARRGRGGSSGG